MITDNFLDAIVPIAAPPGEASGPVWAGLLLVAAVCCAGLLTGGALATRFGVFRAGVASAADPKYVVASQRPVTDGPAGG